MRNLRILIGRHYDFNSSHYTSMIIENLVPILKSKFDVKIIWFCFSPERLIQGPKSEYEEMIDVHDFKNGNEIIKKVNPDLVFDNEYPSIMDLVIFVAAKKNNIPTISKVLAEKEKISLKQFFMSFLPMFFHSNLPADSNGKKQFMRRGRFFIFKCRFFLNTLKAIDYNFIEILKYFFIVLKIHIFNEFPYLDSRLQNELQFLENESLIKLMIEKGYSPSKLVVTGNPIYDKSFKKINKFNTENKKSEKIRILFVPIQLYEGGIWTKQQRDSIIKKIVREISQNKNEFVLKVKLHPSSQIFEEYESLIHGIDNSIEIFQKGSLEEYLEEVDVVISFGDIYSSLLFALIAKKPLIICDYFNYNQILPINDNVVLTCENPKQLSNTIKEAYQNNDSKQIEIEKYLKSRLYKTDGCASERLCDAIIKLIEKEK